MATVANGPLATGPLRQVIVTCQVIVHWANKTLSFKGYQVDNPKLPLKGQSRTCGVADQCQGHTVYCCSASPWLDKGGKATHPTLQMKRATLYHSTYE